MKKHKVKTQKQKLETTKKLLVFTDSLLFICVALTFIGWFLHLEVSSIVSLDGIIAGLSGTLHGFYIWKAKNENCRKHIDVNAFISQYGVEAYRAMTTDTQTY